MPTTEHTINDAIASLLRDTRSAWRDTDVLTSENTGMLKGSNKRPDILVLEPNVSPVAIETELMPAATVESDACSRLGECLRANGRQILSCLAIRMPRRLATKQNAALKTALANAIDLDVALYTGKGPTEATRWPQTGWIRASLADVSVLAQSASIPPEIIEQAADKLVAGVSEAAGMMADIVASHSGAIHEISVHLRQHDGEQTRRMASTILANAFVFHGSLARGPGDLAKIKSVDELRNARDVLTKSTLLAEWRKILKINYWPIFDIARRILEVIPAGHSKAIIDRLTKTADDLLANRLMRSHDLTGAVFQKLIADRKYLAAFYTTPPAAALLAGLAISPRCPPGTGSWDNADDVSALRIADFACGTGTLLSAAYQRIGQIHELAGGDAEAIHPQMMAAALVGCDVLPAAAHLTASMLSGAHPTVKYTGSSILTVAYGQQANGDIRLGSLDLLDEQGRVESIAITAKSVGATGETETETWWSLSHASFDLVLMNPPFTRSTGHEGKKIGVPHPMFAAFEADKKEQRLMAKATKRLTRGTAAHGNAGEASIFLVLASRKLKPKGVLGLVMPLSLLLGDAWDGARSLLRQQYQDLVLVSIAGSSDDDLSFSADTGTAECLVVGRKRAKNSTPNRMKERATFVILRERPASTMLGSDLASQINKMTSAKKLKTIEDGPVGGSPIKSGDVIVGYAIDALLPERGTWNLARIADLSLGQAAYAIQHGGLLWLPGISKADAVKIRVATIEAIAVKTGPYHADINGKTAKGDVRGPFDIAPITPGSVPTYPALWSHDAAHQRTLSFDANDEASPKVGRDRAEQIAINEKVARVWGHASHAHFNRDFRFNSQPTGMQFTPRQSLGGSAWIAIKLKSVAEEKALVLWANTSLGLLLHWWHANKQHAGRGRIGVAPLESMPVLDVTRFTKKQLSAAAKVFDDTCRLELLPIHQIDKDAARRTIDERFCKEILDFPASMLNPGGPLDLLRMKLAKEPSIRGSK